MYNLTFKKEITIENSFKILCKPLSDLGFLYFDLKEIFLLKFKTQTRKTKSSV